jgi:hypothetical protein
MHGGPADGLHAASARKPPARVVQVSRSAGKIGLSVAIDTLSTAGLARNVNSRYNLCFSISQHAPASGNAISTAAVPVQPQHAVSDAAKEALGP